MVNAVYCMNAGEKIYLCQPVSPVLCFMKPSLFMEMIDYISEKYKNTKMNG